MQPKKTLFSYFVITLYLIGIVYIFVNGVSTLGLGQKYPALPKLALLLIMAIIWFGANGFMFLAARKANNTTEELSLEKKRLYNIFEIIAVVIILLLAAVFRLDFIRQFVVEPASDYKTYFEVAELLLNGDLIDKGEGYCQYISVFPHVYGFSKALSGVFKVFGVSVTVALRYGVIVSIGAILLTYLTARLIGGRFAGICALLLSAFWPSQIAYSAIIGGEALFSFRLMMGIFLFVLAMTLSKDKTKSPILLIVLYALVGVELAAASFVRPTALIGLIAIMLCTIRTNIYLEPKKIVDQKISLVFISKGWVRCLLMLACYLCVVQVNNARVENAIDRELAGGASSFGYNLLAGLNEDSVGGWNQQDVDTLLRAIELNGEDPTAAQGVCRDLAFDRLKSYEPERLLNLLLNKFELMWGNDDYGHTAVMVSLQSQGTYTNAQHNKLFQMRENADIFYYIVILMAGMAGLFVWKKGNGTEYLMMLIFVGTVGMHLFVEMQNRYHYHVLFMFAILAGCGMKGLYEMNREKAFKQDMHEQMLEERKREDEERYKRRIEETAEFERMREQAMKAQFDMKDALEKGLIKVSVTEEYEIQQTKNTEDN